MIQNTIGQYSLSMCWLIGSSVGWSDGSFVNWSVGQFEYFPLSYFRVFSKIPREGFPENSDGYQTTKYLEVTGSGGLTFNKTSRSITFNKKGFTIYVQTDKGIYKPGQTGKFRWNIFTSDIPFSVWEGLQGKTGLHVKVWVFCKLINLMQNLYWSC